MAPRQPLLCLPGLLCDRALFEPVLAALGDIAEATVADLTRHDTIAGMAEAALDEAPGPFALCALSMGGHVAMRYAIKYPARVAALIPIDSGGVIPPNMPEPPAFFYIVRTPVLREFLRLIPGRPVAEATLKASFANQALVTPEMVDRYWKLNRREGTRAATLKRFQTPYDTYIQENAAKIATPTLILWGASDTLTPRDMGEAYNAAIKGSRLVVFNNVGHVPMEEVPEQSARAVRNFLLPEGN